MIYSKYYQYSIFTNELYSVCRIISFTEHNWNCTFENALNGLQCLRSEHVPSFTHTYIYYHGNCNVNILHAYHNARHTYTNNTHAQFNRWQISMVKQLSPKETLLNIWYFIYTTNNHISYTQTIYEQKKC